MFDLLIEFFGGKIAVVLAGACLALLGAVAILLWLLMGQAETSGQLEAVNQQNSKALSLSALAHKATEAALLRRKEREHADNAETDSGDAAIEQARQADQAAGAWLAAPVPAAVRGLLRAGGDANDDSRPGPAGGPPAGNAGTAVPG